MRNDDAWELYGWESLGQWQRDLEEREKLVELMEREEKLMAREDALMEANREPDFFDFMEDVFGW